MKVSVISLKRTPERWNAFLQRNEKALSNCEIVSIDGIDGNEILNCRIKTRLINHTAHQEWSEGAIGAGLSHLHCWRLCFNSKSPLVVMEDDVVLADCWQQQLQELINSETEMVLLGWNLDSVLRAKFSNHLEIITLFEPAYPSEDLIASDRKQQSYIRKSQTLASCLRTAWLLDSPKGSQDFAQ